MNLSVVRLITIITEPVITAKILKIASQCGVTGYTLTQVKGHGSADRGTGEIPDEKEKIQILAEHDVADQILEELSKKILTNYSVIVFADDVEILRPAKFQKKKAGATNLE